MALEAPPQPNPGKQEQFMYKGRLHGYTQRSAFPLPLYQTFQDGVGYPLQFRSSVVVDGVTFTSPLTFSKKKEAERYAAKFALESILSKIKEEGIPLIHNDSTLCKSILHEFAAKTKMVLPTYTTTESKGLRPMFATSVVFDGKSHQGGAGRRKNEAEQIGARAVIEWILGHSDASFTMAEVIKSKSRLFGIRHGNMLGEVPLDIVSNGNDAPIVTAEDKLPVRKAGSTSSKCFANDTSIGGPLLCNHHAPAVVQLAKTEKNKGRHFVGCSDWEVGRCGFFKWVDQLNVAEEEVRNVDIDGFKAKIVELEARIEKGEQARTEIEEEVKLLRSQVDGWKTKLADVKVKGICIASLFIVLVVVLLIK